MRHICVCTSRNLRAHIYALCACGSSLVCYVLKFQISYGSKHSLLRYLQNNIGICLILNFGTSVRHSSRSAFGRSTGNDVSGNYFHHSFFSPPFFFSSVTTFSHKRSARIKKLILMGTPKNLWVDLFSDPVGHFGAPWKPFWIFEVFTEVMIESKNLFCESWSEDPIT